MLSFTNEGDKCKHLLDTIVVVKHWLGKVSDSIRFKRRNDKLQLLQVSKPSLAHLPLPL